MKLLVIGPIDQAHHDLQRRFGETHRLIVGRAAVGTMSLLRHLPTAASGSPVLLRLSEPDSRCPDADPGGGKPSPPKPPKPAPRLTRLEWHRLLVGPGGVWEGEDLIYGFGNASLPSAGREEKTCQK